MKIGFLQFNPRFGRIEANLCRVRELTGNASCDLLVLPELFSTGYTFRSRKELFSMSETVPDGRTTRFLRQLSIEKRMAIVGGFPERAGKKVYNSALVCLSDGEFHIYRKKHLYYYEKRFFHVALEPFEPIRMKNGVKLGIIICFDWIFPEAIRSLSAQGAHIICHPANLVLSFCQDAMITRALENRVYVVTANRTGIEKRGRFSNRFTGMSQVVSPEGRILTKAGEDEEVLSIVRINYRAAENKHITPLNSVFRDRRKTLYKGI
jgi:predicted amidohydrolase